MEVKDIPVLTPITTKVRMPDMALYPKPTKPARYFLPDGRPAVQHERCGGSGYIMATSDSDSPCSGCEEGLLPATGLEAARLLLMDALTRTEDSAELRIKAALQQIEDVACNKCLTDRTEPIPWR